MNLRTKLIGSIIIISIIFMLLSSLVMTSYNKKLIMDDTQKNNEDVAEAISISIDNYLNELSKTVRTLASTPVIKDSLIKSNHQLELIDEEQRADEIDELNNKWMSIDDIDDPFIQQYLSNHVAGFLKDQQEVVSDWYGEIFLTNKYGELVASTSKLTTLAHGHKYWWLASYNNGEGKLFFDDRGYDSSVEGYVLGVVVPVYEKEEVIGILKCNINILDLLDGIINKYFHISEPSMVKIARSGGLVVFELNEEPLSTELDENYLPLLEIGSASDVIIDKKNKDILVSTSSISNTTESNDVGFGGSYESIDHVLGNDSEYWVVVLTMPKELVDKEVNKTTFQYWIIELAFIVILFAFSIFFTRRITNDLKQLVNYAEEIGKGNFNHIKIKSKDEVSQLALAFNHMLDNIEETMASKEELIKEIEKRKEAEKKLKYISTIDELTKLYNRRAYNDYLSKFMESSKRYNQPLSVAMIDIDHFKDINDSYGHHIGDQVLIELADILKNNTRKVDILSRWGGEEFIILMPNINIEEANKFAQRIREKIEDETFVEDIRLTVSIGITELKNTDTCDELLKRVDDAQYKAKANGRNNVQIL